MSATVFNFVLWAPYFLQINSSPQITVNMRVTLTVVVSGVAVFWYIISSIAWTHKHENYVKESVNIQNVIEKGLVKEYNQ
jgi:hypothetical protein